MKITKIPQLGIRFIQNIPGVITLGEDFAIFDDLNAIPVLEHPIRIEALAFSMCLKGHMELSLDMEHYSIAPGDIILIRPNNILQHISHSDDLSAVFIAMNVHSTLDIISLIKRTLPPTYHYMKEAPLIHLNDQERQCVSEYYQPAEDQSRRNGQPDAPGDHRQHPESDDLRLDLYFPTKNTTKQHLKRTGRSTDRTVHPTDGELFSGTPRCGLLRRQTVPDAEIPLANGKESYRVHRRTMDRLPRDPRSQSPAANHRHDRPTNLPGTELSQPVLFRQILQEPHRDFTPEIPERINPRSVPLRSFLTDGICSIKFKIIDPMIYSLPS